jgi:hypothetical protein
MNFSSRSNMTACQNGWYNGFKTWCNNHNQGLIAQYAEDQSLNRKNYLENRFTFHPTLYETYMVTTNRENISAKYAMI